PTPAPSRQAEEGSGSVLLRSSDSSVLLSSAAALSIQGQSRQRRASALSIAPSLAQSSTAAQSRRPATASLSTARARFSPGRPRSPSLALLSPAASATSG